MNRRVVITGCSAITPIGYGKQPIVDSLLHGRSGIRPLRDDGLLTEHIHSRVFGTVDYPIDYQFKRAHRKTMGPVACYACQVAKDVLEASGLSEEFITSGRLGVAFGSTHGSPTVQREIYKTFFGDLANRLSSIGAVDYLRSMVHTTAVNITRMFGITGRVIASSTACTTSSQAIGFGYETIKFGLQDAMICGGADEYDTTTVAVFDNLLACSVAYNDQPSRTPRPFDAARDGLVVGEGGGAVLLEEYEAARRRGAPILGEVIGFACNNNGGDLILPNLEGITATLRLALDSAGIGAEQVDLISAHATATKMGDVVEAQAIAAVYGDRPWVAGLKSYMGHTMGTCGVIELALLLYMMEQGFIAPTLNLENVDSRCAMIRHVRRLEEQPVRIAALQNFAFGGVNTCLIIRNDPDHAA
ncbi:beta-ketoacyl-[acyl-carrier-protein] synthase family protein [Desulfofustis limnaeus]|jgi:3-oxoacyl-[acyl-carrier-protein] synthase II|uniref:Beta-ketoacyl-ACP synthase II n=1 Tax=Desulfofustis limnaeus TaxID=2740163 RepID=A0ABM7W5W8_9BACT|nr:beta-ketoacyl synthase N-terminal-like domain-containing protein [Desulfofustis limnaeus]MDX9896027.1 beta-ketoacyl synthase N-terminal-like domain-containing protein [Desulfofustis sp.]BDD86308.1 beta-ketoacyl-ACP synthase II [Desulfofustis limnaeus]